MADDYAGEEFQAFGLEQWGGSVSQTNAFLSVTGITYPCLLYAGLPPNNVDDAYACTYEDFFVVGGDGLIAWRRHGWSNSQCRAAVDQALADLATPALDLPERDGFLLQAAYPNPFNPATTIAYTITGTGDAPVDLKITDVRGRTVRTLFAGRQTAGETYQVLWDGIDDTGRPAHSGTFLTALTVRGITQSRFITLVK
ncbi:hypothetical protein H8E07_09795 [bacterium]|nr:hypothetical protein [bacterium]